MPQILLMLSVALGGAVGAALRVGGTRVIHGTVPSLAPWVDLLAINAVGCFAFGWLFIVLEVKFQRDGRSVLRGTGFVSRLANLPGVVTSDAAGDPTVAEDLQGRGRLWSAYLLTGILGGMTSFSAFSVDVFFEVWTRSWSELALNVGLTMCVTVIAMLAGMECGVRLACRKAG
jgi:fluoride ion exporter CrcB/FEX